MKRLSINQNFFIVYFINFIFNICQDFLSFKELKRLFFILAIFLPIILKAQNIEKTSFKTSSKEERKICDLLTETEVANAFGTMLKPNIVKVENKKNDQGISECIYWYSYYNREEAKPDFNVKVYYSHEKPAFKEFEWVKQKLYEPFIEPKPELVSNIGEEAYWDNSVLYVRVKGGILRINHYSYHLSEFIKKVSINLAKIAITRIK